MERILKVVKVGILASATFLVGLAFYAALTPSNRKTTDIEKASVTVKITTISKNSGGTGTIIDSNPLGSLVLTNSHVCKLIGAKNGLVTEDDGTDHGILSYKESNLHDLCLITVAGDLHKKTAIATKPPTVYDEAVVSGHPALYPTIITKGHFTGKLTVNVMIGTRPCTLEELQDNPFVCLLIGGYPIIKTYESQLVSATIMAGSSGSAVYNANGEIAGVIFAGSGDLSYGLIVPYEYVAAFLYAELPFLDSKAPNSVTIINSSGG